MRKIFLLLVVLTFCLSSFGQFVYLGSGFQYNRLMFQGGYDENLNTNTINLPITIGFRPVRYLEISFGVAPSLRSKTKFSLKNDRYLNPNSSSTSYDGHYKASEYDYSISRDVKFVLAAKLFFETSVNSYFEIGISSQEISESFTFRRPAKSAQYYSFGSIKYGALSARNFNYSKSNSVMVPTLAFGMKPHISKRIYLDIKFRSEFININSQPFSYTVEHSWDFSEDRHEFYEIKSLTTGTSVIISGELGFGVFF